MRISSSRFNRKKCPETGEELRKNNNKRSKANRGQRNNKGRRAYSNKIKNIIAPLTDRFLFPGPQSVLPEDQADVLAIGKCAQCGSSEKLTVDHIIPRSRGGGSHRGNLQPLCEKCNKKKADSFPTQLLS